MHIRDQRNSNNFHGYKKIDLIINSKFIGSQQTHHKRVTSYGSPGDHCIENQEREMKPSSYYLRALRSTKNYSHIIGEAPKEVVNPIQDGV